MPLPSHDITAGRPKHCLGRAADGCHCQLFRLLLRRLRAISDDCHASYFHGRRVSLLILMFVAHMPPPIAGAVADASQS